jgi:2-hydroxy-3-keto-5-methylthiopentenyl-1-phosphate phosphatase
MSENENNYLSLISKKINIPISDFIDYADHGDTFVVIVSSGQKNTFVKSELDSPSLESTPHRGRPRLNKSDQ